MWVFELEFCSQLVVVPALDNPMLELDLVGTVSVYTGLEIGV